MWGTFRLIYEMKSQVWNHLSCFPSAKEKNCGKKNEKEMELRKNDKGTSRNDAAKWNWQESRDAWSMLWMRNEPSDSDTLKSGGPHTNTLLSTLFGPALSSYYSNWNRFSVYFSHFFHRNWNSRPMINSHVW